MRRVREVMKVRRKRRRMVVPVFQDMLGKGSRACLSSSSSWALGGDGDVWFWEGEGGVEGRGLALGVEGVSSSPEGSCWHFSKSSTGSFFAIVLLRFGQHFFNEAPILGSHRRSQIRVVRPAPTMMTG